MAGAPSNHQPFGRTLSKVLLCYMRLPQSLLDSPFFIFSSSQDFLLALKGEVSSDDQEELSRLIDLGLPPVASVSSLATLFGLNPGIVVSMLMRPAKHYRRFEIPKGRGVRVIHAPRIGLKLIQKWLSIGLLRKYEPLDHVFGFVPGRSHILAAARHTNAQWIFSVDIENFFPSTPAALIAESMHNLGFGQRGAELIKKLVCLNGGLAQGSPASPVLSNIAFDHADNSLVNIASKYKVRLTRYADDIVFSGIGAYPDGLREEVESLFDTLPWTLAAEKCEFLTLPKRLKVHGLLVHGERVRLTKGYRNKLRAYSHLLRDQRIEESDMSKVLGHIRYGDYVHNFQE